MRLEGAGEKGSQWPTPVALFWGGLLLVVCVRSFIFPHTHSVYPIYAGAGANWAAGRDCYRVSADLDHFRYSPLVSSFFVPFSLMPDSLGGVIWRLLSAGCYLAAFAWYVHAIWPGARLGPRTQTFLWLLLIPLSLESLSNGQANVLVMASLLAGVTAVARERWNLAAACLAVAFLFKLYPLAMGLLLVAAYPRQLGWRLALACVVGLVLPFALQNPDYVAEQYARWFLLLASDSRLDWPLGTGYRDAYLLLRFFVDRPPLPLYLAMQILAAAALALVAWQGRRNQWPARTLLHTLFGLGCCWMMLFGPATESSTYILLAAPLACALVEAFQGQGSTLRRAVLVLVLAIFVVSFSYRQILGPRLPLFLLQPLGALLLFCERGSRIFPGCQASI
jgi:hypothetical protein